MAGRRDDAQEGQKNRTTQIVLAVIAALSTVIVGYWQFGRTGEDGDEDPKRVELAGRVFDSMSGKPIPRAEVALEAKGAPQVRYTDSKGVFVYDISDLNSTVVVRVEAQNYQPFVRLVTLTPNLPFQEVPLLPLVPATQITNPLPEEPSETVRTSSIEGGPTITVESNTDRQFSDYAHIENTTLEVCVQACLADTRCKAFVYDNVPTSWGYKYCWLKNSVPQPIRREGSTSGVKSS